PVAPEPEIRIDFVPRPRRISVQQVYPATVRAKPAIEEGLDAAHLSPLEWVALRVLELNAEEKITRKSIKKSYRRLVRQFHPDRCPPNMAEAEIQRHVQAFREIQEAYVILERALRIQTCNWR